MHGLGQTSFCNAILSFPFRHLNGIHAGSSFGFFFPPLFFFLNWEGGCRYRNLPLRYTSSLQQAWRERGRGWENPLFAKWVKVDLTGWKCGSSGSVLLAETRIQSPRKKQNKKKNLNDMASDSVAL